MSGQRSRKIHQRSSSTGSGLLFGIGAAAGPHHVIHPQHHLLASQQLSSPSPDPLTSDDEESEDLDIKGTFIFQELDSSTGSSSTSWTKINDHFRQKQDILVRLRPICRFLWLSHLVFQQNFKNMFSLDLTNKVITLEISFFQTYRELHTYYLA